jgi:hypothetical protein
VLVPSWLFDVPQGDRSDLRVILWWEQRRIPYNLIVGCVGLCSLAFFELAISRTGELKPGEDAVEPMALFVAPFLVNIAYTAGWVVEIVTRRLSPKGRPAVGPILLKLGLTFSALVALFPAAFWGARWAAHAAGVRL